MSRLKVRGGQGSCDDSTIFLVTTWKFKNKASAVATKKIYMGQDLKKNWNPFEAVIYRYNQYWITLQGTLNIL